jgi:uncharacterized glyoxalase superfamily metalloenzyme YdcJ
MDIISRTRAPVPPDVLRARFGAALSDMYRAEVPLYGALLELVGAINAGVLAQGGIAPVERHRLSEERHGAIRLGTPAELRAIARAFAVLGMVPVGYYDLAPAGLPVHSTAFRPITRAGLDASPFRVFTSLLRLDQIHPPQLAAEAAAILAARDILTEHAKALIVRAEQTGGLDETEAQAFVEALLETFRWHNEARVDAEVYRALVAAHGLVADVVSFRGPHINHLTPRVLDIDAAQVRMQAGGFHPKAVIEGPPARACPILLRQTSFRALDEKVCFPAPGGGSTAGVHTARFGEIEQRGLALTREGRARYDRWVADGGDLTALLPDDETVLRREGLAYFRYEATDGEDDLAGVDIEALVASGGVVPTPITYEDFLPVSAAGIFRSNLGAEQAAPTGVSTGDRDALEAAIGRPILDEFALYAQEQTRSLAGRLHTPA